jgi:ferrous iron transport protein A
MIERTVTLADLKRGEKAKIMEIHAEGITRQRLLNFGFRPGKVVQVVRLAPLADPIELTIDGGHISLRCSEASLIMVERQM